ncbi:hypothetical protein VE02_07735 [Pseudogymnoascus sp. 03VT05]|nr:hypothetical protein VE02_07735 [Pseudogymnoascus sp. 03VT05]
MAEETDEEWIRRLVPEKGVQVQVLPDGPMRLLSLSLAPSSVSRRFGSKCGGSVAVSGAVVDCTLLSWLAGSVQTVDVHATPVRATGRVQAGGSSVQDEPWMEEEKKRKERQRSMGFE